MIFTDKKNFEWFRLHNQTMMELSLCYGEQGFKEGFEIFDIVNEIMEDLK